MKAVASFSNKVTNPTSELLFSEGEKKKKKAPKSKNVTKLYHINQQVTGDFWKQKLTPEELIFQISLVSLSYFSKLLHRYTE